MWPGLPVFLGLPGELPCSDSHGFGELRDDAELLHEALSVPVDPAFHHLSVREAGNAYPGDGELLSRWRNPVEITIMGTATGPPDHYCFTFGNDVFDRQSNVGEGIAVEGRSLLLPKSGVEGSW